MKPETFIGLPQDVKGYVRRGVKVKTASFKKAQSIVRAVCDAVEYEGFQFRSRNVWNENSRLTKVTPLDVRSKNREREVMLARQLCCHFIRHNTMLTLKQTGEVLGGLNHSTVHHSDVQVVMKMLDFPESYPELHEQYLRCKPVIDEL